MYIATMHIHDKTMLHSHDYVMIPGRSIYQISFP